MFGSVTGDLSGNNITGYVHNYISLLSAIIFTKLTKILDAETGGHFIASGCCDEVSMLFR